MMGAVASTFLALIFPPLCHMAVTGYGSANYGPYGWRLMVNAITLLLGAIGFVTGTYASLYELWGAFQSAGVTPAIAAGNHTTHAVS